MSLSAGKIALGALIGIREVSMTFWQGVLLVICILVSPLVMYLGFVALVLFLAFWGWVFGKIDAHLCELLDE